MQCVLGAPVPAEQLKRMKVFLSEVGLDGDTYSVHVESKEARLFKQGDNYSCGIFVIRYMYYLMTGEAPTTPCRPADWRAWVLECIVRKQLVPFT